MPPHGRITNLGAGHDRDSKLKDSSIQQIVLSSILYEFIAIVTRILHLSINETQLH